MVDITRLNSATLRNTLSSHAFRTGGTLYTVALQQCLFSSGWRFCTKSKEGDKKDTVRLYFGTFQVLQALCSSSKSNSHCLKCSLHSASSIKLSKLFMPLNSSHKACSHAHYCGPSNSNGPFTFIGKCFHALLISTILAEFQKRPENNPLSNTFVPPELQHGAHLCELYCTGRSKKQMA